MSDLALVTLPNGTTYSFKDEEARAGYPIVEPDLMAGGFILENRSVNVVTPTSGDAYVYFTLPEVEGHAGDVILDIDNSGNVSDVSLETYSPDVFAVSFGADLVETLTVYAGMRARLYFAQTGFEVPGDPSTAGAGGAEPVSVWLVRKVELDIVIPWEA